MRIISFLARKFFAFLVTLSYATSVVVSACSDEEVRRGESSFAVMFKIDFFIYF